VITQIEDYFLKGCGRCDRFDTPDCSTKKWSVGQAVLRQICLNAGLAETVKWGHPCYMQGDRNIAIIGAFRDNFRLTFMNAALLKDPDGVLQKQGPNTQTPDMIYFTENQQPTEMATIIRAYLKEAMEYAANGIKPIRHGSTFDLPEELVETLDADSALAEAFHQMTPGRQRSYVIALNSAKTSETRFSRIAKFREKILLGKGAQER
jgi:uncharacterized protein YdeI (YjbR/CyaY-like superfamily)